MKDKRKNTAKKNSGSLKVVLVLNTELNLIIGSLFCSAAKHIEALYYVHNYCYYLQSVEAIKLMHFVDVF